MNHQLLNLGCQIVPIERIATQLHAPARGALHFFHDAPLDVLVKAIGANDEFVSGQRPLHILLLGFAENPFNERTMDGH